MLLKQENRKAKAVAYFLAFLTLGLIVAYLNRHHLEQQTIFYQYISMAEHYKGEAERTLLTYPAWGYPFVLMLLPQYDLVVLPQVLLATVAMSALFLRLCEEMPRQRRALAVLFLGAIPWYLLHSVKWPLSFSASFIALGILFLERAISANSVRLGLSAGVMFGLALYFRSEFLFLPLFIVFIAVLSRFTRRFGRIPLRPVAVCAATAWALLIPWGLHYRQQTGRFSLTASQRGTVAFISLGQLPHNPWGAVYEDEYAYAYLKEHAPHLQLNTDAADRLLFNEFKQRVVAHPVAFAEKMAWNGVFSLVSGFYGGEIPLSDQQGKQFRTLRTEAWSALFPAILGGGGGGPAADALTRLAFLYWLVAKSVGSLFIILSTVGLILAIWHGIRSPLFFLLAATIIYQGLLFVGLTTEPRYKNGLYLYLVPFLLVVWTAIWQRLRKTEHSLKVILTKDKHSQHGALSRITQDQADIDKYMSGLQLHRTRNFSSKTFAFYRKARRLEQPEGC